MGEEFNPKIAIFGDLGLKNAVSLPYLRKEVHSKAIDLIIHAGDIAYDLDDVKTHKNEFQTYFSTSFPFFLRMKDMLGIALWKGLSLLVGS